MAEIHTGWNYLDYTSQNFIVKEVSKIPTSLINCPENSNMKECYILFETISLTQ